MPDTLFIGVDGGGSRTRARLRDDAGSLLGEGEAGPGNVRLGEAAFTAILDACRHAVSAAGLDEGALKRVHAGLGLAGTQQDVDLQAVLRWPHPFASVAADTDAYAAYLGAHGGKDGAILILGTGSAGLAVVDGKRVTVGGWGAQIADEGSGMAIGRAAIRRSLWALEGMAPLTPFAEDVLAAFDRDPASAVVWAGEATPGDFASFAPRAFDYAERRDMLAVAIVEEASAGAAMLVNRLLDLGAPTVAMIGSVFPRLLPWLSPPLRRHLVDPKADAMDGAILMARLALQRAAP